MIMGMLRETHGLGVSGTQSCDIMYIFSFHSLAKDSKTDSCLQTKMFCFSYTASHLCLLFT